MTDRGTRIMQKERNFARWARIVRTWSAYEGENDPWFKRTVRMLAGHGKLCSCHMCGNRRRHGGLSIQERRALDKAFWRGVEVAEDGDSPPTPATKHD